MSIGCIICVWKGGYDYEDVIEGVFEPDYILHLRGKGEATVEVSAGKRHPARRWVVERTHAWYNKFRRLLVRWERKVEHYKALVQLASVLAIYRLVAAA